MSMIPKNIIQPQMHTYDYVFVGMGASNGLMLLELIKRGYHTSKRIIVIEPLQKNTNDKTYCFWASPESSIVKDLSTIISYQYNFVETNVREAQSIEEQPYHCIRSIDFYNHVEAALNTHAIERLTQNVKSVISTPEHIQIITDHQTVVAAFVFDSRPPNFKLNPSKHNYLLQSFFGYHIRLKDAVLDVNSFQMMNFDVDQSEHTQFVYNLPYGANECLVELTRFGVETIDKAYAKKILDDKIVASFGAYDIIAEEEGCIPMTVLKHPPSTDDRIIHMGARANLIKPTTGYGFKKMYEFAEAFEKPAQYGKVKNRFSFYDHLLLIILIRWPHLGKKIFSALFQKNTIHSIYSFLDEKSTLSAEIKIFASLPLVPFLKACVVYAFNSVSKKHLYVIGFMVAYFVVQFLNPTLASQFGYIGLIAGLLLVGIPHGAVDHLLLQPKAFNLFRFVVQYLLIIAAYFIVWQWFPLFSLLLFIAYSAYHFGESEMIEINASLSGFVQKGYAFLVGLSILFFIIFSHLDTSLTVLKNMDGIDGYLNAIDFIKFKNKILGISILALLPIWQISKQTLLYLVALLLAGTQMPLMLAFGLYFVGSHSIHAWGHIATKLNIGSAKLYVQSLPFNIGALLIFVIFLYLQHANVQLLQTYAATFFVFLACISLPHIVLMHLFYKKTN